MMVVCTETNMEALSVHGRMGTSPGIEWLSSETYNLDSVFLSEHLVLFTIHMESFGI